MNNRSELLTTALRTYRRLQRERVLLAGYPRAISDGGIDAPYCEAALRVTPQIITRLESNLAMCKTELKKQWGINEQS